jgi:drug/metabolite transporter (DMT)-like permease
VTQGRQVVDLADHKARYSLVVMGVLNAGVLFLISRAHLVGGMSPPVRPWLIGFLAVYGALTFLFVYYAVDCLRPRQMQYCGYDGNAR